MLLLRELLGLCILDFLCHLSLWDIFHFHRSRKLSVVPGVISEQTSHIHFLLFLFVVDIPGLHWLSIAERKWSQLCCLVALLSLFCSLSSKLNPLQGLQFCFSLMLLLHHSDERSRIADHLILDRARSVQAHLEGTKLEQGGYLTLGDLHKVRT